MKSSDTSSVDLSQHVRDDFSVHLDRARKPRVPGRIIVDGCSEDLLNRAAEHIQIPARLVGEGVSILPEIEEAVLHSRDLFRHFRVIVDGSAEQRKRCGVLILHFLLRETQTVFSELRNVSFCLLSQLPDSVGLLRKILSDHFQISVKIFLDRISQHSRSRQDLIKRKSGVGQEQRVEHSERICFFLAFFRVEGKDNVHQFDKEVPQRQKDCAPDQIDQCVERRDSDRSCLGLEKRNTHHRIDQVEDHQKQSISDQVVEQMDQRRPLSPVVEAEGGKNSSQAGSELGAADDRDRHGIGHTD